MAPTYVLGPFRLDAKAEILFRGAEPVALGQRAVALLRVLLERPGTPVSKDVLMEAAWAGLTVEESNLAVQISALRRVYGQEPGGEGWIETLPRRGYRFVGPASVEDEGTIVAATLISNLPTADGGPSLTLPNRPSIAVLPLQNMSGDPEQEYFADGISEDVITDLSKISGLFVIARNSSFAFRGKSIKVQDIARDLGVAYVVEGSVRKAGNRVRITAQLIDGSSGGHVWAERYDRDLTDIFDVQDEVTGEILAALKVHLTPDERRRVESRVTSSLEAHDRFLRGRQLFWQTSREAIAQAQTLFEEAIRLDPDFCLAHAYLAFTHTQQAINRWSANPEGSLERAKELVERALTLDPTKAEAYYVRGIVHLWQQKDVDQAIADAERAIALDPNFARGYGLLGAALHYAGRSEEALERLATMARLDPHHPPLYQHFVAQALFALGRFEDAVRALKARLARQPDSDVSRVLLAACYGYLGRAEDARAEWQEALRVNPGYSIEHRRQILPYRNPADFERVVLGLQKAGLPV